jgi:hypothetical protein
MGKKEAHTCSEFKGDGIAKDGVVGEASYACRSNVGFGVNGMMGLVAERTWIGSVE